MRLYAYRKACHACSAPLGHWDGSSVSLARYMCSWLRLGVVTPTPSHTGSFPRLILHCNFPPHRATQVQLQPNARPLLNVISSQQLHILITIHLPWGGNTCAMYLESNLQYSVCTALKDPDLTPNPVNQKSHRLFAPMRNSYHTRMSSRASSGQS